MYERKIKYIDMETLKKEMETDVYICQRTYQRH